MGYGIAQAPFTIHASAARTATPATTELRLPGGAGVRGQFRGLAVIIDVTAVGVTPSVVFALEVSDGPADAYASVLTSAAVTAVGTTTLIVHPSVPTARANTLALGPLKSKWRLVATHGNGTTITYSVVAFGLR